VKFVITGGTGFIGGRLVRHLSSAPHDIVLLTRSAPRTERLNAAVVRRVTWDPLRTGAWAKEVDGADAVINLVGKNVFEQRWNARVKRAILESRTVPTALLVEAMAAAAKRPPLFVSASAVGYYGECGADDVTEENAGGSDFLAYVVQEWEGAAYAAERLGVRVATPRIGLVLQKEGGMVAKMLLPFRLFAGGPVGTGRQYLPWVHMEDVVRGLLYPVENASFRGVYNLAAPSPVTMKEFAAEFGGVLRRPSWAPVPPFVLSLLFGEGGAVILSGQRALPKRLEEAGFRFSYTELRTALENILR